MSDNQEVTSPGKHAYENTLTNSQVWKGAVLNLNMQTIHTNATIQVGGSYSGPGTPTVKIPPAPI